VVAARLAEIGDLVAHLHQHAVLAGDLDAAAALVVGRPGATGHVHAHAEIDAVIGHREAGRAQVVQRVGLHLVGAVGDIDEGDAAGVGRTGEFQRAGHRAGTLLGHPFGPAFLLVRRAVEYQPRLVG